MTKCWLSKSVEQTINIGIKVSHKHIKPGDIINIIGEMGTGKTQLAKGIIQGINPEIKEVTSPSYLILKEYNNKSGKILHIDLYRIENRKQLIILDLKSIFNKKNVVIIEWPEKGLNLLPKPAHVFRVEFNQELGGNLRKIFHQKQARKL